MLEERLHNGDVDRQVSILRKVFCHGGLKDEAVGAGDDAGNAFVDAPRLCLPRQLPVTTNQFQLVPAREKIGSSVTPLSSTSIKFFSWGQIK